MRLPSSDEASDDTAAREFNVGRSGRECGLSYIHMVELVQATETTILTSRQVIRLAYLRCADGRLLAATAVLADGLAAPANAAVDLCKAFAMPLLPLRVLL